MRGLSAPTRSALVEKMSVPQIQLATQVSGSICADFGRLMQIIAASADKRATFRKARFPISLSVLPTNQTQSGNWLVTGTASSFLGQVPARDPAYADLADPGVIQPARSIERRCPTFPM